MKIGVFGGTFDPIHLGHLIVADAAREMLELDEVLFIPTGRPWVKAGTPVAVACHRMAMVEISVGPTAWFRIVDLDIKRPGPTYTVDTLLELRAELGEEADLYLLLGLDAVQDMARWHRPAQIFELCTVVGMSRPGVPDLDLAVLDAVAPNAADRVILLEGPLVSLSGTDLRRRVREGRSIRHRVPEAVEVYIYEHGLYR